MTTIFRDPVTINGVDFNNGAAPDASLIVWNIDNLDGWNRTPEMNTPTSDRTSQDGTVIAARSTLRGRNIYVEGYVVTESRAAAEAAKSILVGQVFPRSTDLLVVRTTPAAATQVTARRVTPVEYPVDLGASFRWATSLLCADPLRYSTDVTTVGPVGVAAFSSGGRDYPRDYPLVYTSTGGGVTTVATVTNLGTAPTPPVIEVRGDLPFGGWRLSNDTTGEDISFNVAVGVNDVLRIDHKANRATLNNYPVTSSLVGDFWRVVPGENQIRLYSDLSDANFTVTIRSAWE